MKESLLSSRVSARFLEGMELKHRSLKRVRCKYTIHVLLARISDNHFRHRTAWMADDHVAKKGVMTF